MSRAGTRSGLKRSRKAVRSGATKKAASKGARPSGGRKVHRNASVRASNGATDSPQLAGGAESPSSSLFPLEFVTKSPARLRQDPDGLYDPEDIVDAPEHHALSNALGILTWDIWDHDVRPFGERKRDFVTAFPPRDPVAFSLHGMERITDHEWRPRSRNSEVARLLSREGRPKGIDSLLARYGLKLKGAPPLAVRTTPIRDALEAARERNHSLRVLHGSVDVEANDMDSAKTAFVEQQERKRAAEEIREARRRLNADPERDR